MCGPPGAQYTALPVDAAVVSSGQALEDANVMKALRG
jgi:hypothetical protein